MMGAPARGVAAWVPWDEVAGVLAGIESDDAVGRPGCGPIALGVLPFSPSGGTELVIPAVTIGKGRDGERWITTIDGAEADLEPPPAPIASAGGFTVVPGVSVETYLAAVAAGRHVFIGKQCPLPDDRLLRHALISADHSASTSRASSDSSRGCESPRITKASSVNVPAATASPTPIESMSGVITRITLIT